MKKIVAIGGGTGLATLLRGLKKHDLDITAIVTMTDDGSSTGRLRRDFNQLPPGDVRQCIAALSLNEDVLRDLFSYRFKRGFGLSGHSVGNLLISALTEMTGSFELAVEKMSELLEIKGKVLPATLSNIHLGAEFLDGRKIIGESKITQYGYGQKIKSVFLSKPASTNPKALKAIKEANAILIGPGSLFTSIIPNFLHQDLLNVYQDTNARRIYICNVSTERGETDNFTARHHTEELEKYGIYHDHVLLNDRDFPVGSGDGFVKPVRADIEGEKVIRADIVKVENPLFHDSDKLAFNLMRLINGQI